MHFQPRLVGMANSKWSDGFFLKKFLNVAKKRGERECIRLYGKAIFCSIEMEAFTLLCLADDIPREPVPTNKKMLETVVMFT